MGTLMNKRIHYDDEELQVSNGSTAHENGSFPEYLTPQGSNSDHDKCAIKSSKQHYNRLVTNSFIRNRKIETSLYVMYKWLQIPYLLNWMLLSLVAA